MRVRERALEGGAMNCLVSFDWTVPNEGRQDQGYFKLKLNSSNG